MALITCTECSKEVSEFAPSCPHCGFPLAAITKEGKVALRNCPDCGGSGTTKDECSNCVNGLADCIYCRGYGTRFEEKCTYCGGSGRVRCDCCGGQGYFRGECQTCDHSGQITIREYEEIIEYRRGLEEANEKANQERLRETQAREQVDAAQKLSALKERLIELNGALLHIGLAQDGLILSDTAYAVDRAKIMKIYGEQLQALRIHRFQCQFCGEPLERKERLRRLQVHDKQDCKEGWDRVSKQIAENNSGYEKFMRENAPRIGDEG